MPCTLAQTFPKTGTESASASKLTRVLPGWRHLTLERSTYSPFSPCGRTIRRIISVECNVIHNSARRVKMKLARRTFLHLATGAASMSMVSRVAFGQPYPVRPVRMIVPFAPGGQNDAIGRLIAQKLSEHFGRQFIIENVGGGGGVIGTSRAGQAAHDGYTLLVMDTGFVINPHVYPKVPYDPFKDYDTVSIAVTTTQVLTVTPSLPVRTVKELVELVKVNPGKYSYASPGIGTPGDITADSVRLTLR